MLYSKQRVKDIKPWDYIIDEHKTNTLGRLRLKQPTRCSEETVYDDSKICKY